MHIPDGFLSTPVWLGLDAAALPAVGWLARRAQRQADEARLPLLGVMSAFVFAAQMVNFPVGPGTSGHLVGGALLAIALGPAAAAVAMTAILGVQALVFQDGGVLALGANVLNMAVVGVLAGYLPYRAWGAGRWRRPAIVLSGLLSVLAGAALALAELLASGVAIPAAALWISVGLFTVTGLLEGIITLAVVDGIAGLNPKLVRRPQPARASAFALLGIAAVLLATFGVLAASSLPDGLEALGIAAQARALIDGRFAGLAGAGLIFGICTLTGRAFSRRRAARQERLASGAPDCTT